MKILVTNDDGINAIGLKILVNALKKYASEILVVAPIVEMSATSHKLTLREGLDVIKQKDIIDGIKSYSVSGTPADCVKIGLNLLKFEPDVIFSGINNGYNIGNDIVYSGTASAAIEANLCGYKGIAVSFKNGDTSAEKYLDEVLRYLFNSDIYINAPILNINIPSNYKGIKITHQGSFPFVTEYIKNESDGLYYANAKCIGFEVENTEDSDVYAIFHGYASITPLTSNRSDMNIFEKYKN